MEARDVIRDAIRDHGPISFEEYMELALYGGGGYYDRLPVGVTGDFVTSPHVHPVFASLLASAIVDLHGLIGEPSPLRIAEVGAGDGTLARGLLEHLVPLGPAYLAVDRSPGARGALALVEGVEVAPSLEGSPHVVLANELLDNLPFRRFRGTPTGAREVLVGLDGETFAEELAEPSADAPAPSEGEETILPTGAIAFVDELAARLARPGYALLIDYGGVGEPGGPVHGYRDQRPVENVLDRPGATDITAGVDFAVISAHAERAGLVAFPTVSQRHALTSLGFDRWIHRELERQAELLDRREALEAVRTWSGRSAATILVDPTALGRLRWLLLATPGLPAPSWL